MSRFVIRIQDLVPRFENHFESNGYNIQTVQLSERVIKVATGWQISSVEPSGYRIHGCVWDLR